MSNPWDERYSIIEYIYGKEPNDFLREHYKLLPKGTILSLAEGEGRNAVFLAKQGYRVIAIDSSSVGLEKASKLAKENKVAIETVCADLAHYQLDKSGYEGIVSIFCHIPPEARKLLYAQLGDAIKPGGVLLLEAYTADQIGKGTGGPPTAELTNSLAEMNQYLDEFDILHAKEFDREVVEGRFHSGIGSVVQIIAKRK